MSRKKIAVLAVSLFLPALVFAAQIAQTPIGGSSIPRFAQPLPLLSVQGGTFRTIVATEPVNLHMCEFRSRILPAGAVPAYAGTWVWGYLAETEGLTTCSALVDFYSGGTGILETYLGPVFVSRRGTPTSITYINDLGSASDTQVLAYRNSTDQTLHWADPDMTGCMEENDQPPAPGSVCAENYLGSIPAVAHLHGGEVPAQIDGGPEAWFTSDGIMKGATFYSAAGAPPNGATYVYPNVQEAAPLWFHDHTLGATRLNVFAGLAGAYYIYDDDLALPEGLGGLEGITKIVPLVLQDRMFDTNGQLFFPAGSLAGTEWALNPEHPYWVPEFVGDTIVVNGKAWPYLEVEPKPYRFLFLNGSNARTYELFVAGSMKQKDLPIYVIGTDGGYLDSVAAIDPRAMMSAQHLIIMPGERYEAVIDFTGVAPGTRLLLKNVGKTPFPAGDAPSGAIGKILEFRVGSCTAAPCAPAIDFTPASGVPLRANGQRIVRLADPAAGTLAPGVSPSKTRELTLNEIAFDEARTEIDPVTGETTTFSGGPLEVLVNNSEWIAAVTERPDEGATELWEIVNLTADAHPIHLHLVQFQIVNRQPFDVRKFSEAYEALFPGGEFVPEYGPPLAYAPAEAGGKYGGNPDVTPYLKSVPRPPLPHEAGWKDTAVMYPGQVTRIAVRWAPTDKAVGAPDLYFAFDPSGLGKWNYVWHCHIVDHEDNEMMRPYFVTPKAGVTRTVTSD